MTGLGAPGIGACVPMLRYCQRAGDATGLNAMEPRGTKPGAPPHTVRARLRAMFPESSGRRLKQWLGEGRVRLSGRVVRDGREPVRAADTLVLAPHGEPVFPAGLRRVHEDDALLVIEKPPGLLSIATEKERERTAYRLLGDYLAAAHPPRRPFIVHRLDRDTSGLLVVAKSLATKRALQAQFERHGVERVYEALVEGTVRADGGTLESLLVEDRGLRVRSAPAPGSGRPAPLGARRAVTHYRVLERRSDVTRLELRLDTGRRHQIRVQLAELGHPIVGDRVHGSRHDPLRRLCLHATRLGFLHPATRALVRFDSPAPPSFARVGRGPRRGSGPMGAT